MRPADFSARLRAPTRSCNPRTTQGWFHSIDDPFNMQSSCSPPVRRQLVNFFEDSKLYHALVIGFVILDLGLVRSPACDACACDAMPTRAHPSARCTRTPQLRPSHAGVVASRRPLPSCGAAAAILAPAMPPLPACRSWRTWGSCCRTARSCP